MKTISFTPVDKNGVELNDGDIILCEYGTTLVTYFSEKDRMFIAYDEAPFPITWKESDITKHFEVIGNVAQDPDFKPIYEVDIYKQKERVTVQSLMDRLCGWFH